MIRHTTLSLDASGIVGRACLNNSVWSEWLLYTQLVIGSNPILGTWQQGFLFSFRLAALLFARLAPGKKLRAIAELYRRILSYLSGRLVGKDNFNRTISSVGEQYGDNV